jgi:hypothetical protein
MQAPFRFSTSLRLPTNAGEPVLISTAGKPKPIEGLPPDWPQEIEIFYSDNYPVLFVCGALKKDGGVENGQAFNVCTLKDIDGWIKNEKENRKICWYTDGRNHSDCFNNNPTYDP